MYTIYTDGSYKPTTGQGGYASIIIQDGEVQTILTQGFINTTNNRMELLGLLSALKHFDEPIKAEVFSDSSYVVNSITQGHYKTWLKNKDESKKNLDIWDEIADWLAFHDITMHGVKGHNDNEYNEKADLYANMAAIVINPIIDRNEFGSN